MTNPQNENFYVSPELAEIIRLVIERSFLETAIKYGKDSEKDYITYEQITNRLETLVKKEED